MSGGERGVRYASQPLAARSAVVWEPTTCCGLRSLQQRTYNTCKQWPIACEQVVGSEASKCSTGGCLLFRRTVWLFYRSSATVSAHKRCKTRVVRSFGMHTIWHGQCRRQGGSPCATSAASTVGTTMSMSRPAQCQECMHRESHGMLSTIPALLDGCLAAAYCRVRAKPAARRAGRCRDDV